MRKAAPLVKPRALAVVPPRGGSRESLPGLDQTCAGPAGDRASSITPAGPGRGLRARCPSSAHPQLWGAGPPVPTWSWIP